MHWRSCVQTLCHYFFQFSKYLGKCRVVPLYFDHRVCTDCWCCFAW